MVNLSYKTSRVLSALCFLGVVLSLGYAKLVMAATEHNELAPLFQQATYWHKKSHDELAIESLKKVLMVDAENTKALYLLSLWSAQRGNLQEATQWRARLAKTDPSSPLLLDLSHALQFRKLPQGQIDLARQQAQIGNISGSLATWRKLFNGETPPLSLAPEYYLTMAGSKSSYSEALKNLRQLTKRHPNNTALSVSLGKVLTFRRVSRREGIRLLERTAENNQEADHGLRQALLWLAPRSNDARYYKRWMHRHPKDIQVLDYYRKHVGSTYKQEGFHELNQGHLDAARRQFQRILKANPDDPDALAGMGYVALRERNYADAAKYLQRAAQQSRSQSVTHHKSTENAEFYSQLAKAKLAYQKGHVRSALALSRPLVHEPGSRGIAVQLFRADVLRHHKDYLQAERTLKEIIRRAPHNMTARENLFYVLSEQNKSKEAENVLHSLPKSSQIKLQPKIVYTEIRNHAAQSEKKGDDERAIATLLRGLNEFPKNPWLRLDLARILAKQGRNAEVSSIIDPLYRPDAGGDDLYAAALFASDHKDWHQVKILLARIPKQKRDKSIQQLAEEADVHLKMAQAKSDLSLGHRTEALSLLKTLLSQDQSLKAPSLDGRLARLLSQSGDLRDAVALVHQDLSYGIRGNAGDYVDHITVLDQANLEDEALQLLNNPKLLANSTPEQLTKIRDIYAVNEADHLRKQGRYAKAYDLLVQALQKEPHNVDFMMAMARLYQSGKMNQKAAIVYDYLLQQNPSDQNARVGAIQVALAERDMDKARKLASGLTGVQTPTHLLLLAQVAEAGGQYQQAMSYLRKARSKLVYSHPKKSSSPVMIGGLAVAENPFMPHHNPSHEAHLSDSVYQAVMPWQVAKHDDQISSGSSGVNQLSAQAQTLSQVNQLITQLSEKTETRFSSGFEISNRDGESGLGQLTQVKAPLTWSSVPFGDARLKVHLTPVYLDAGQTSGDASRRLGTGALIQGEVAEADGISTSSGDTLPSVSSQGDQHATGVEVGASVARDNYKFDIGTTPLGTQLNTLVGGIQWSPQITENMKVIMSGERRSVTDSLLSYVGVKDKFSGKRWGQVTKNGGNIKLSYDDGHAGFYVGGGIWRYLGKRVSKNSDVDTTAGFYIRPVHDDDRELKSGMNISTMFFSKNLSYYSFGQGGYFSPQNYISVSFPVEYTQHSSNWNMSMGGAIGYQSYHEDKSAYFPNNADLQSQLQTYATAGETKEANYQSSSHHGLGYNVHAKINYKLNPQIELGGRLNYDTFGDYRESSAQAWLRYILRNNK